MLLKHGLHQWTWASVLFHFLISLVSLYSTLVWRFQYAPILNPKP
jgi:hypothetical protein